MIADTIGLVGPREQQAPSPLPTVELTVDELAREAAIPTSTVRLYQQRGLLPPPVRRGRIGVYGQEHRDRLRLIAHLQERGFSLAAIREALDAWADGRSLDHLLGLADVAPELTRAPLRLTLGELAARFEGVALQASDVQRAVALGLIQLDGDEVVVSDPAFAEIGPAVVRLGVPVSVVLDHYVLLRQAVEDIVEQFGEVFERYVWERYAADGLPAERLPDLGEDVSNLTSLATEVVLAELRAGFERLGAAYLERAKDSGPAGRRSRRRDVPAGRVG